MSKKKWDISQVNNDQKHDFFLTFYAKPESVQLWVDKQIEISTLQHYAFIEHNEEGKKHIHLLVHFSKNRRATSLYKHFNNSGFLQEDGNPSVCSFIDVLMNRVSAYDYLTHKDDTGKYQYSEDAIIESPDAKRFFNCDTRKTPLSMSEDTSSIILKDFLKPDVNVVSLAETYGKDFIYHYTQFRSIKQDVNNEKTLEEYESILRQKNASIDRLNEQNTNLYTRLKKYDSFLDEIKNALLFLENRNEAIYSETVFNFPILKKIIER